MIKNFLKQDKGAFTAIFAVMVPILMAGASLAVDVGFWYSTKRDLQNAADAGALAGAYELLRTNSQAFAETEAGLVAAKNIDGAAQVSAIFPASNQVQVTVEATAQTFFIGHFISDPPAIAATALAELTQNADTPPACLNLLDGSGEGLRINGNGQVNMGDSCGVQVNSSDENAVNINGDGARLISDDVCINGGFDVTSANNISSEPKTGCPPISNPYAHLEVFLDAFESNCPDRPTATRGSVVRTRFGEVNNFTFGPSATRTMQLTVQNGVTVTLSGGDAGFPMSICFDLTVRAGGTLNVRGNLIFTNGASLKVQAQGNLNIFEPQTEIAEFEGLSIIGTEANNAEHKIIGGGSIFVSPGRGISVPGDKLEVNGGADLSSASVSITAKSLEVGGNSSVQIGTHPPNQPIPPRPGDPDIVRLIN
jgi:hypothetical protein